MISNRIYSFILSLVLLVGLTQISGATIIGNANLGATAVDNAGESRLNIELDAVSFVAGTYGVSQFEVDTDGSGIVTPLLLQRNALDNGYDVIWVGSDINVSGTSAPNVTTTNYTPGSEQFTVTGASTDVFVGAWQDGNARVRLLFGGGTDHDGGVVQTPTTFILGQNILDSDITNSGLPRTYSIGATIIPEPSTLILTGLAFLSLGLRRKKRNWSLY